MKNFRLFFVFLLFCQSAAAQDIPIGQWKDNLSYKNGLSVAQGNGKVYCLTAGGIIVFNPSDNSMERLSKVNGLSDIELTALNFNSYNNKLFVAYENSNIDIIESNGTITNMVDIKIQQIFGSDTIKKINDIYFINQYAYLSCVFGIAVIDMNLYQVVDTYIIGPRGNTLNVRSVTSDTAYLYAATDSGVYRAPLKSPDLANYAVWSSIPGIPKGIYNSIVHFNGKIYTNYSKYLSTKAKLQDTTYVYNNITWNYFGSNHAAVNNLDTSVNNLLIVYDSAIAVFNTNGTLVTNYTNYFGIAAQPKRAVMDNNNNLWIADHNFGLVSNNNGAGFQYRYPNGPNSSNVNEMSANKGYVWVAPGDANTNLYANGLYSYADGTWNNVNGIFSPVVNFDSAYNINHILVDPKNAGTVYATATNGLIKLNSGTPTTLYNTGNSTLKSINGSGTDSILIGGLTIDSAENLWITNSFVSPCLSVKKANGAWLSIDFSAVLGASPSLGQILIDNNNQIWMVLNNNQTTGIAVYNGNGAAASYANTVLMTKNTGNGNLPTSYVYCFAQDLNGAIWVGTQEGIAVFFSPQNVFSGQNYDAQQIFVQQNGQTQILLETELVQAIAIDGANRKWIATQGSGVYLMSADGTQQIYHFTSSNSPLFSNNVLSIAINQQTGEVYFGTTNGIVSFRGTATAANENFTNVYAFPNPVKPGYQGVIAIKGLTANSSIQITDINGILVYETQSQGGQAIWDGKNAKGERVGTGIYMVFCASQDGSKSLATKILFVN